MKPDNFGLADAIAIVFKSWHDNPSEYLIVVETTPLGKFELYAPKDAIDAALMFTGYSQQTEATKVTLFHYHDVALEWKRDK